MALHILLDQRCTGNNANYCDNCCRCCCHLVVANWGPEGSVGSAFPRGSDTAISGSDTAISDWFFVKSQPRSEVALQRSSSSTLFPCAVTLNRADSCVPPGNRGICHWMALLCCFSSALWSGLLSSCDKLKPDSLQARCPLGRLSVDTFKLVRLWDWRFQPNSTQIRVCPKSQFHIKVGHVELNLINLKRTAATADSPPIPDFTCWGLSITNEHLLLLLICLCCSLFKTAMGVVSTPASAWWWGTLNFCHEMFVFSFHRVKVDRKRLSHIYMRPEGNRLWGDLGATTRAFARWLISITSIVFEWTYLTSGSLWEQG